jgi:iron complex transport system substrate-binding protein
MRAVSLLPSATEMLYALDVEPVGVSHECDYPPAAADKPAVNRSRVDATASSEEIDDQVQSALEEGGVYEIDRETLAALDPDVVVSQGICEVCAVDDSDIRAAIDDLGLETEVVTTDPHSLADVFADLERLGRVLDREEQGRAVRAELESRVEAIAAATPEEGPRVAVLDWLEPPMVAGHWVPGMVDRVGGEYGLAAPGDRSRPREWSEIREYDPEVLVAAPCGFEIDQTRADAALLRDCEGFEDLTAVQNDRVYALDGHHYVNRPGPRLVDTLAAFARVVHPEAVAGTEVDVPADAIARFPVEAVQ